MAQESERNQQRATWVLVMLNGIPIYNSAHYYAVGNDGGSFKSKYGVDGCVPNGRHRLEITPYSFLVDGKVWAMKERKGDFQLENNLYLFASNALSTRKDNSAYTRATQTSIICYGCTIVEGDILVRNFVPCVRKRDAVVGFYDTVGCGFYMNAGTGVLALLSPYCQRTTRLLMPLLRHVGRTLIRDTSPIRTREL